MQACGRTFWAESAGHLQHCLPPVGREQEKDNGQTWSTFKQITVVQHEIQPTQLIVTVLLPVPVSATLG